MITIPKGTVPGGLRRGALAATLSIAVAAALVTVTDAPATANSMRYETNTSWAYTDSHRPTKIYLDQTGDVPVGSWKDDRGRKHTSRAYFTFDITRYRGAVIESATFSAKETSVADCTKRTPVELWRTAAYTADSSWRKPPADKAKLYVSTLPDAAGCPAPYVEWDAAEGLRQALAEGASALTVSLRLPAGLEPDPTASRRYASTVGLSIDYNYPPGVPTELKTSAEACSTNEPYELVRRGDLGLSAVLHDEDGDDTGGTDMLTATFALWPVDDPDARTERTDQARNGERAVGLFPADQFAHDQLYAWQVRAADDRANSDWSGSCYFRTDFQGPATAPAVSSTDFPSNGEWAPALPGEITFAANGAADAVGFGYQLNSSGNNTVAADRPGGSATVTITPRSGVNYVEAWSVDAAGNRSGTTRYDFLASDVGPILTGNLTEVGVPTTFAVQPRMGGVVRYRFHLDGDPEQTVEAEADGTASLTVTATRGGNRTLSVTSVTGDGVTATSERSFRLTTAPKISATVYQQNGTGGGQGVPGVFTFTPRQPDVVSYRYRFGAENSTVAAAADGTASVTWTPTKAGFTSLTVWSVNRDGVQSDAASFAFIVRDLLPSIQGLLYDPGYPAGGPGQAGDFLISSEVPDTTEFRYRFDDGPEQGIAADINASAIVTWTPEQSGTHTLTVRSIFADGTASQERTYTFLVADAPPVEPAQ
ncbi:hypothetical protein E1211_02500 [Micromonospora sp. 15K316]|uniref:hypothetical protein n=1 Tax=Micromonospora sp. 15K316 TaxID=2530376 RepID=UPI00104DAAC2|nr:hypothetical protein [Micromonospora sp. 15K316]TDC39883.1 hypothetical protein E1211_02500 [Micromonospora sp. 15K316]